MVIHGNIYASLIVIFKFSNFAAILDARQRSSSGSTRNRRLRRSRDGWTDGDAWRRGSTARWYRNTDRRIRTSPGTYRTRPRHRKWVHCTTPVPWKYTFSRDYNCTSDRNRWIRLHQQDKLCRQSEYEIF